jgi:hypothetical protein
VKGVGVLTVSEEKFHTLIIVSLLAPKASVTVIRGTLGVAARAWQQGNP